VTEHLVTVRAIREPASLVEVRSACGDDDMVMWAAQGLSGGVRAWACGDAIAVAGRRPDRRSGPRGRRENRMR
jgi:hypothetical protein